MKHWNWKGPAGLCCTGRGTGRGKRKRRRRRSCTHPWDVWREGERCEAFKYRRVRTMEGEGGPEGLKDGRTKKLFSIFVFLQIKRLSAAPLHMMKHGQLTRSCRLIVVKLCRQTTDLLLTVQINQVNVPGREKNRSNFTKRSKKNNNNQSKQ